MAPKVGLGRINEPSRKENRSSSTSNQQAEATGIKESNENSSSSSIAHERDANLVEIDGRDKIISVAFLVDGKHVVSGGNEERIRRWRVEDGTEVGTPMDAGSPVYNIAVSRDGKWIVSGTESGLVTVWDATSHEKVTEFKGHNDWVCAVDISPDGTRIATGSDDKTAWVWSFFTGERLLGPLEHDNDLATVKFSPGGLLIATATWERDSIRIYDSQDGRLLVDFPIQVSSGLNRSLAWVTGNSKQLFALSRDGYISRLDASTGTTLSKWPIHSSNRPRCIAVASNGEFVAASANSLVSFWDTTTHQQIGSAIDHTHDVLSMAISASYGMVTAGDKKTTLRNLCDILPSPYCDDTPEICLENADIQDAIQSLRPHDDHPNEKIASLERTIQHLSESQRAANQKEDSLNKVINSLRARDESSNSKIVDLEETLQELRNELAKSHQQKDSLNETIRLLRADLHTQETHSANLEKTVQELRNQLVTSHRAANQKEDSLVRIIHAHEKKQQCEALYAHGRIYDAVESLLEIVNTSCEDLRANKLISDWLAAFTRRCVATLERVGVEASNAEKHDEAVEAYSTALSLTPSTTVLIQWARTVLIRGSAHEALRAAAKFKLSKFYVYREICDVLEGDGRVMQAVECFRHMQNELPQDASTHDERVQWELGFRRRSVEKLEKLGDTAMDSKNHDGAIGCYSNALSLNPTNVSNILVKCCKARVGLLEKALIDATKVTEFDPSSYKGYKRRHVALHGMGRYREAFGAFEMVLLKLEKSPDPHIRELHSRYVDATPTIRHIVQQTIRHMPRVLIDTTTGRLNDKTQQAAAFEQLPIFNELRSSMTTRVDNARIRREVKKYYRYVMLSHKWRPNEPTYQMVENVSIYELPASPTNSKLLRFCGLVRSRRFKWAWSDTCCVNQADKGIQQESVVAMFRWYRGSSLTVVHLLGVFSDLQEFGSLWRSIWNTRGWTYQEYLASEVVQFYTEDWKPYLGLDMFNHKESPIILSEMQQAMNFPTQQLVTLQPGLDRVREKLYLASKRQTTREEDIAYSLFGIFKVAIPIIYGEGNQAVGRLLEYILTRSDNVTLLSWTGISGSHNSYLPADLTVYDQIAPPHVPQPMEIAEMDSMVMALHSSLPNPSLSVVLYERLFNLSPLSLVAGRLRLPGIVFPLTDFVPLSESDSDSDIPVYHATTPILGDVEIKTTDNLAGTEGLLLIHPWISPLLDQDFSCGVPQSDLATRALRLVVRLRQPFGALLLAPLGRVQYRRVATDSLIMVRAREEISLTELIDSIRRIDIQ